MRYFKYYHSFHQLDSEDSVFRPGGCPGYSDETSLVARASLLGFSDDVVQK